MKKIISLLSVICACSLCTVCPVSDVKADIELPEIMLDEPGDENGQEHYFSEDTAPADHNKKPVETVPEPEFTLFYNDQEQAETKVYHEMITDYVHDESSDKSAEVTLISEQDNAVTAISENDTGTSGETYSITVSETPYDQTPAADREERKTSGSIAFPVIIVSAAVLAAVCTAVLVKKRKS